MAKEKELRKVEIALPPGMTQEQFLRLLAKAGDKPSVKEAEPVIFAELENGHNKQIRVHHTVYKGRSLLSIQNFWREDENSDWQYGKAVTFDYELIQDIIDGLTKMKAWCEELPND